MQKLRPLIFAVLIFSVISSCGEDPQNQSIVVSHQSSVKDSNKLRVTSNEYEDNNLLPVTEPALSPLKGHSSLEYREGELLVKFRSDVGSIRIQSVHRAVGAGIKKRFAGINIEHVKLPYGLSVQDAIKAYKNNPDVEYAEPNYIVRKAVIPNDIYFNLQWGLNNTGQEIKGVVGTYDADIDAPEAWNIHTGTGDVIVAVLDTGVDYNHPDLLSNIWTNTGETDCNNGLDDDGNGYKDDCRGWNFADSNNNTMDDDVDGHGSHVAGIIGAVGSNNTGVSGVNWKVKLMPLKFLNSTGEGTIAGAIEAMNYAAMMGAKVINASYTYPQSCITTSPSLSEMDAIRAVGNAGVLFIAAAGNYGCDNDTTPFYPASHKLANIISVAASDQNDNKPSWSNYGKNSVHVAAPGVNIYSTIRRAIGGYAYISGTSMATPFVSGLAGLIASGHPDYTYLKIKEAILNSVDKKTSLTNRVISGGRINAYNAYNVIISLLAPSNLSASALSVSQIALSWQDNSPDETGLEIERKTGADETYSLIATVGADVISYSDTGLIESTTYYYRVRAYNASDYSFYSNEAYAITLPAAPSGPLATAVSSSQIDLSWTDNSGGETGFKIERKRGLDGIYSEIATVGADIITYSDRGLSSNTTYYYRVRAYNSAGDSSYSNEVWATTQPSEESPPPDKDPCFIATAAYGSHLAPKVEILREFRDRYLISDFRLRIGDLIPLSSPFSKGGNEGDFWISRYEITIPNIPGKAFVRFYYTYSPPIADFIRKHETLRTLTRIALTPFVYSIKYPFMPFAGLIMILVFYKRWYK